MEKRDFGTLPDGRRVDLFTLKGDNGVTAAIMNYGGRIVSLKTPDRKGRAAEIGMGFTSLAGYVDNYNYCGALVGRVANRIGGGEFVLDGKRHKLWLNDQGQHLHGGENGYSFKLFTASEDGGRLRLDYLSPDGEEHYPGNLTLSVWYSLAGTDLTIDYEATTDRTTVVNLTNHTFFNLNGFKRDVLAHELRLSADHYNPVQPGSMTPTGENCPVAGTPFDFNTAKPIGRDIDQVPGGYDINYVFKAGGAKEWRAEAYDPDSGRTLAMATDQPCTQFYSGNFLDGSQTGIDGAVYKPRYAFCLEAQKQPDAVNQPKFTPIVLKPGEKYRQTTIYRFGRR